MDNQKHWYAVYTKPRWEKKVDHKFMQKEVESWCPLQKVQRQWSDRKKIIEEPLFKSYVFVKTSEAQRVAVLQTEGVLNFVFHAGKPAIIKDEEIEVVKSYLQESDTSITTQSWESLPENLKVKVNQGIFMDTTGTVVRSARKRIYVRLETLGQVMIVEFAASSLSPLSQLN